MVYAAVAFAVLEAADIVIPALGFREEIIRWVIALALLGFPVTLILAWIYDLTPRGVIKTRALGEGEEEVLEGQREGGRPVVSALLLLFSGALLALAAFFAFEWSFGPSADQSGTERMAQADLNPLRVAVLPFVDLDGTDQSGFLANGIHDDILNHLAKIDALEVISRTTLLQYRDTEKPAPVIGQELGAGSILEGSVRRFGDRIRVVAQLIDARTDNHIWSDTFDREEADIFRVQSEIAQEIARALRVELTSQELEELEVPAVVTGPAYNKYAEGITVWDRREDRRSAFRAAQLFQEAVDLSPDFALAHAALAQARMWLFWNFPGAGDQAELARAALDRALELAPEAVETLLAQGYFYFYGRGDSEEALRYLERAQELKPSDASVISTIGLIRRGRGEWEAAVAAFAEARRLDPGSYSQNYLLAETYLRMRRYEEAESAFELAATLAPEVPQVHRDRLRARLLATGDTVAAREFVEDLPEAIPLRIRELLSADVAYYRGDYVAALVRAGTTRRVPLERSALLYHLLDRTEERDLHADSLLQASQAILDAVESNPGPVQAGVMARAQAKLGLAYALKGDTYRAVRESLTATSTLPLTSDAYEGANLLRDLVATFVLSGMVDLALEPLETALTVPSPLTPVDLRLDPLFRPLQEHPAVQALLANFE